MNQHVACDGCGIAKDDLREIEMLQRREDLLKELFSNAARIRRAMRSNAWLRPVFRKYKRSCREILDQKKKEAAQFTQICEYCVGNENASHEMKVIHDELEEIHAQIKSLENLRESASSSSSDLSSSSSSEAYESDSDNNDNNDSKSVSSESLSTSSSSTSSSSSSSSSSDMDDMDDMDLEDFL